jgi:hypothetical protein
MVVISSLISKHFLVTRIRDIWGKKALQGQMAPCPVIQALDLVHPSYGISAIILYGCTSCDYNLKR